MQLRFDSNLETSAASAMFRQDSAFPESRVFLWTHPLHCLLYCYIFTIFIPLKTCFICSSLFRYWSKIGSCAKDILRDLTVTFPRSSNSGLQAAQRFPFASYSIENRLNFKSQNPIWTFSFTAWSSFWFVTETETKPRRSQSLVCKRFTSGRISKRFSLKGGVKLKEETMPLRVSWSFFVFGCGDRRFDNVETSFGSSGTNFYRWWASRVGLLS